MYLSEGVPNLLTGTQNTKRQEDPNKLQLKPILFSKRNSEDATDSFHSS
jgi:hypothetical protein